MELFDTTVGRMTDLLLSYPLITLYAFFCTIVLCLGYQIITSIKARRTGAKLPSFKHYSGVYVFLFYVMVVFLVTGMGTIWEFSGFGSLASRGEIQLVPFAGFDSVTDYILNIIMMIPFGFLLAAIWPEYRSLKKITVAGFLFSLVIELSQLFNLRATTTDDLIMNTLGAILGYGLLRLLLRIVSGGKRTTHKRGAHSTRKPSAYPRVFQHEATTYLVCSFLGMFLFYNPALPGLGTVKGITPNGATSESQQHEQSSGDSEQLSGIILRISGDKVVIDRVDHGEVDEEGGMSSSNTGVEIPVLLTEETVYEISRTNRSGTVEPTISPAKRDDLSPEDTVEMLGDFQGDGFVAEKITILKFDG